jgi:hypothetical protein
MTLDNFNAIVKRQMALCTDLLITKGAEYVKGNDRLAAFKKAAVLQNEKTGEALFGMLTKHLVSLSDMVQSDVTTEPIERWKEKITDAINYLLILGTLIEEEYDNAEH